MCVCVLWANICLKKIIKEIKIKQKKITMTSKHSHNSKTSKSRLLHPLLSSQTQPQTQTDQNTSQSIPVSETSVALIQDTISNNNIINDDINNNENDKESKKNNDLCAICQDDMEDKSKNKILQCNHQFHTECIDKWINMRNLCPICNKKIDNTKPIKSLNNHDDDLSLHAIQSMFEFSSPQNTLFPMLLGDFLPNSLRGDIGILLLSNVLDQDSVQFFHPLSSSSSIRRSDMPRPSRARPATPHHQNNNYNSRFVGDPMLSLLSSSSSSSSSSSHPLQQLHPFPPQHHQPRTWADDLGIGSLEEYNMPSNFPFIPTQRECLQGVHPTQTHPLSNQHQHNLTQPTNDYNQPHDQRTCGGRRAQCANCYKLSCEHEITRCPGCQQIRYCSSRCLEEHFSTHCNWCQAHQ